MLRRMDGNLKNLIFQKRILNDDDDFDKNDHPNRIFNQIIFIIYTDFVVVVAGLQFLQTNYISKKKLYTLDLNRFLHLNTHVVGS